MGGHSVPRGRVELTASAFGGGSIILRPLIIVNAFVSPKDRIVSHKASILGGPKPKPETLNPKP